MPRTPVFFVMVVLITPLSAPGEEVYQFRTEEEPGAQVDTAVCEAAPFPVSLRLKAAVLMPLSLTREKMAHEKWRKMGTAVACARLTDPSFPPGLAQDFYVHFELPQGHFSALGTCTLVSNDVPRDGVVLAGCALRLVDYPSGKVGGMVMSTSVFNPLGLPGIHTGSRWTLLVYDEPEDGR